MIFVIGYIFGPFSKKRSLTVISRVAAVFLIVLFIASNAISFRGARGYRYGNWQHECGRWEKDSIEHHGGPSSMH